MTRASLTYNQRIKKARSEGRKDLVDEITNERNEAWADEDLALSQKIVDTLRAKNYTGAVKLASVRSMTWTKKLHAMKANGDIK